MVSSVKPDGVGTLLVSSPLKKLSSVITGAGAVYVFNGTGRHWSQMQKLVVANGQTNDQFGSIMELDGDRVVIASKTTDYVNEYWGQTYLNHGAAYIFERNASTLMWSYQSKLEPRDGVSGIEFGSGVSITGNYALVTSKADDKTRSEIAAFKPPEGIIPPDQTKLALGTAANYGNYGGSVYVFQSISGQWSQQQKLTASDLYFWHPKRGKEIYGWDYPGVKRFANSVTTYKGSAVISIFQNYTNKVSQLKNGSDVEFRYQNRGNPPLGPHEPDGVAYVYSLFENIVNNQVIGRWSLQQRLFVNGNTDYGDEKIYDTEVSSNNGDLMANMYGPAASVSYMLKHYDLTDGTVRWSMQARLTVDENPNPADKLIFSSQNVWGGNMIHKSRKRDPTSSPTAINEVSIRTQLHNGSCLILWLSDHMTDGWDTAVLSVRAPDSTNDTFYPGCNQVDPFKIRYCPFDPANEGVYIVKMFAAVQARFYWEASWQVMVEATGVWYKGDYSTEMQFLFSSSTREFSFYDSNNEINMTAPCYRCVTYTQRNWAESQIIGGDAFWPLVAFGAPYYISDVEGRKVYSTGKVCNDGDAGFGSWTISKYECYQTLLDGVYILRLGGGIFGRETGFPNPGAWWSGCGLTGTWDEQLVFQIDSNKCNPIQKFKYNARCRSSANASYGPQQFSSPKHNIALYEFDDRSHSHVLHDYEDSYNLIQDIMKRHKVKDKQNNDQDVLI